MLSKHSETVGRVRRAVKRVLGKGTKPAEPLPLDGYTPNAIVAPNLDRLTDEDLRELNSILRWNCFTVDSRGRRFGDRAKVGKREQPQPIPDQRIELLHSLVNLKGKTVLEVGCFEGVHTTGLASFGGLVTAVDSRLEHVVKTMVRCGFYGASPKVFLADVDQYPLDERLTSYDIGFHCGVLYHLIDPIRHLYELAPKIKESILLDTHYALDEEATQTYRFAEKEYAYKHYGEDGKRNVFAGMYDHAKWLRLDALVSILGDLGFKNVLRCEPRQERNGARVLLIARR